MAVPLTLLHTLGWGRKWSAQVPPCWVCHVLQMLVVWIKSDADVSEAQAQPMDVLPDTQGVCLWGKNVAPV